jgi:hypothetical protein
VPSAGDQNHPLKAPAFENRKLTINLRRQCVVGAAAPKLMTLINKLKFLAVYDTKGDELSGNRIPRRVRFYRWRQLALMAMNNGRIEQWPILQK